jgi:hypothetical protein
MSKIHADRLLARAQNRAAMLMCIRAHAPTLVRAGPRRCEVQRPCEPEVAMTARYLRITAVALGSCAALGAGQAEARPAATSSALYQLIDAPMLASARWAHPASLRLEVAAGLAPRHELRLTSGAATGMGLVDRSPVLLGADRLRLDPARATYRYTFLLQESWAWKVGLTTQLASIENTLRTGLAHGDRLGFGALPMLHLAGEGRLADRWRLAFAADGLATARGRAYDVGIRVNYLLSPSFAVYGGYRLSDAAGETDDVHSPGLNNSANVGLRYRF